MRYLRDGRGPALVLVHGLLGYSFSWRHAIPVFAQRATVHAVDMLGVGFSDRPAGLDCCLQASAERLLRFLDAAAIDSCDLLGTSHGGAVSMMAASLAPDRIRRLILVAPVNPWSLFGKPTAEFLTKPVGCSSISQHGAFVGNYSWISAPPLVWRCQPYSSRNAERLLRAVRHAGSISLRNFRAEHLGAGFAAFGSSLAKDCTYSHLYYLGKLGQCSGSQSQRRN